MWHGLAAVLCAGLVGQAMPTYAHGSVIPPGDTLTAGAAKVDVAVPSGTPLGGYGAWARRAPFPDVFGRDPHAFWFRPHEGRDGTIAARALVLAGRGARVVWLAVDLVAVDRGLTADVSGRLQRIFNAPITVIISASHTHSGPGAFGESEVMGLVALDRPDPVVRDAIVRSLVDAARAADARRVPARLGFATRSGPDVTRDRLGVAIDRELVVMKLGNLEGRAIAVVWNFAIHPTMLSPRNLALSGDVTGAASRALESWLGVPALFINGAVGDVSPRRHGREALPDVALTLARAVQAAAEGMTLGERRPPAVATTRVTLGRAWLPVRNCVSQWLPAAVAVPLGSMFPNDATLVGIALGDGAWVTIPGELQSALGVRIKEAARRRFSHAGVAGLSNDYLGYFVEPRAFERRTYVACSTLYGAEAGERMTEAAAELLRGLAEQR